MSEKISLDSSEKNFQITEGKVQGVRTTTEGVLLYKGIS